MALDLRRLRVAAQICAISEAADGKHENVIRQAANGNQGALAYILRNFIGNAKQRRALDPEAARLVAVVLERVLAGENIGKILGTQAKRGRPRKDKNAILVHAMVRFMRLPRSRRLGRRGGVAKVAAADALGMSLNTVEKYYKQVQELIKTMKKNPFLDLERSRFSPDEDLYLRDPDNAFYLLNIVKQLLLDEDPHLKDPENALFLRNVGKAAGLKPLAPRVG